MRSSSPAVENLAEQKTLEPPATELKEDAPAAELKDDSSSPTLHMSVAKSDDHEGEWKGFSD